MLDDIELPEKNPGKVCLFQHPASAIQHPKESADGVEKKDYPLILRLRRKNLIENHVHLHGDAAAALGTAEDHLFRKERLLEQFMAGGADPDPVAVGGDDEAHLARRRDTRSELLKVGLQGT